MIKVENLELGKEQSKRSSKGTERKIWVVIFARRCFEPTSQLICTGVRERIEAVFLLCVVRSFLVH